MEDSFDVRQVSTEARLVFDHTAAQNLLGGEEAIITHWQTKRDGNKRGTLEVLTND